MMFSELSEAPKSTTGGSWEQFLTGNARAVWLGLQSVSNYKRERESIAALDNDSKLTYELNSFYARFDRLNNTRITASPPSDASLPPPFVVEECEVRRVFKK